MRRVCTLFSSSSPLKRFFLVHILLYCRSSKVLGSTERERHLYLLPCRPCQYAAAAAAAEDIITQQEKKFIDNARKWHFFRVICVVWGGAPYSCAGPLIIPFPWRQSQVSPGYYFRSYIYIYIYISCCLESSCGSCVIILRCSTWLHTGETANAFPNTIFFSWLHHITNYINWFNTEWIFILL